MLSISLSSCFTNDETLKPFSLIVFLTRIMKSSGASQVVLAVKNPPANAEDSEFDPWVRKIPWKRAWQPTPVFLPGESHGQRSLVGYSPQGPQRVRHAACGQEGLRKHHYEQTKLVEVMEFQLNYFKS